jgi:Ca2+/Na+ antiporter
MNTTLLKALIALIGVCLLFSWSAISFSKEKTKWTFLQVLGTGFLVMVTLTHICEALNLFPFMRWGHPDSIGHYVDLSSAVLGVTLFPIGFFGNRFFNRL